MSLYDYQGHADKDGTGLKVNAYCKVRNAKNKKRKVLLTIGLIIDASSFNFYFFVC